MNNSSAVFGDYGQFIKSSNLPVEKPHYYPSNNKELDENTKKVGLTQKFIDLPQQDDDSTFFSNENDKMVGIPESYGSLISYIEDTSGSSKYNESWPATEQSFPSKNPIESPLNMESRNKEHSIEDYLEKQGKDKENKGTLSKFVQRFRQQPPLSRSERYLQEEKKKADFWWLSSPTQIISSTPYSSDSSNFTLEPNSISFSPAVSDKSSIYAATKDSPMSTKPRMLYDDSSDSAAARMQLRTDKLLELSENVFKDTTSSASHKSQYSLPVKQKDVLVTNKENRRTHASLNSSNESEDNFIDVRKVSKPRRPADDILYKWRLSRKMELAATKASSPNPFLKIPEVNFFNSEVKEKSVDKTQVPLKETNENINENLKETIGKVIASVDVVNTKVTPKVTSGTNEDDVCNDNTTHSHNKCSSCQAMKSKSKSDKENVYDTCHCSKETPSLCYRKLDNDSLQCKCRKPSQTCKCNSYFYHIPSLVHVCELRSCLHSERSNTPRQRNEEVVLENTGNFDSGKQKELRNEDGERKKSKLCNEDSERKKSELRNEGRERKIEFSQLRNEDSEREKSELSQVRSSKDSVVPVIKQVISDHLFDGVNESTMLDSDVEITNERVGLKIPSIRDSSSEDEFRDDEILRELRYRRRKNKSEFRLISERLRQIRQQDDRS